MYRNPSDDPHLGDAERELLARGGAQPEVRQEGSHGASLWYLLGQRKVLGLALGFASYNYTFYLLLTWLPSYLSSTMHIDLLHSVVYTSVPFLVATVTDVCVGGWLVDRLVRRGWDASRVRQCVLVGGTVLGLGIFGAADAHTPTTALLWISIAMGGLAAAAPVGWSIPGLIAPRESVGRIGGIMNFFSQCSAISAPIITGFIASAAGSFYWAFATAGIFIVIGVLSYVLLLGRIEPIAEPA